MRRSLAAGALAVLAVGYLCGLLVTGDAVYRFQLGLPGGSGSTLARTAEYWTAAPGRPLPVGTPPVAVLSIEPLSVQASVAARVAAEVPARLAGKAPANGAQPAIAAETPGAAAAGCAHGGACGRSEPKPVK